MDSAQAATYALTQQTMGAHLFTIIFIMIAIGAFGGYLNFLHNFDTKGDDTGSKPSSLKFILLGVGAALLVPAFLKMISSQLLETRDPINYLIFAGFCLVSAIFSRRFITSIGDRILEAAKKAELSAQASNRKAENAQREVTTAKERIEDVQQAVDLKTALNRAVVGNQEEIKRTLLDLANSYVDKTNVPDYGDRVRLKNELRRKLGELIVKGNFSKEELLKENKSEGMLLGLAYSIQLQPEARDLALLNQISKLATQLYTRYTTLFSYETLARKSFIDAADTEEVLRIVEKFREGADASLLKKIEETIATMKVIV